MTKIYADEWQGKAVWVVGADAPSDSLAQFWIEQEHFICSQFKTRQGWNHAGGAI